MNNKEDVKKLIDAGMYLQTLNALILFAIKNNKVSVIQKIKEMEEAFTKSLNEEEQVEYKNILKTVYQKKAEEFMNELKNVLTPEELQEIVPQLSQD